MIAVETAEIPMGVWFLLFFANQKGEKSTQNSVFEIGYIIIFWIQPVFDFTGQVAVGCSARGGKREDMPQWLSLTCSSCSSYRPQRPKTPFVGAGHFGIGPGGKFVLVACLRVFWRESLPAEERAPARNVHVKHLQSVKNSVTRSSITSLASKIWRERFSVNLFLVCAETID